MSDARARPHVNITIDRLVLKGFPAGARGALTASFEAELRRLAGLPSAAFGPSHAAVALPTAPLRTEASADARAIGTAAARRLVEGLRR